MKRKLILIIAIIFSINLSAQTNSYQHKIELNVGSGFFGFTTNMFIKGGLVNRAYATPIPHLAYTYKLDDNIGIGASVSYQRFNFDLLPLDANSSALLMQINRLNGSLHATYIITQSNNFDLYVGGKLGLTAWYGNISFQQLYDYAAQFLPSFVPASVLDNIIPSNAKFFQTYISYQVYGGADFFISKHIGIKTELAIGATYWAEIGLNYRF